VRDEAIRLVRSFAKSNAVDLWYDEDGQFRLLERYRRSQKAEPSATGGQHYGLTSPLNEEVVHRIRGEYTEMTGLRVTLPQAQRLWGLDAALWRLALDSLVQSGFLRRTESGQYLRLSDGPANTLRMAKVDISRSAGTAYRRPAAS
jgi:hypothetical protein